MRKSFDGLRGIIRDELGKEINAKDVFNFLNKELTHIKILLYEPDGFTLFYRRFHKGRFPTPAESSGQGSTQLSAMDLFSLPWGLHFALLIFQNLTKLITTWKYRLNQQTDWQGINTFLNPAEIIENIQPCLRNPNLLQNTLPCFAPSYQINYSLIGREK